MNTFFLSILVGVFLSASAVSAQNFQTDNEKVVIFLMEEDPNLFASTMYESNRIEGENVFVDKLVLNFKNVTDQGCAVSGYIVYKAPISLWSSTMNIVEFEYPATSEVCAMYAHAKKTTD